MARMDTETPQPPPPEPGGLLDDEQAAAYLKTTPRCVQRMREEGRIGYVKVGKYPRFHVVHLDAYIKANEVKPRVGR